MLSVVIVLSGIFTGLEIHSALLTQVNAKLPIELIQNRWGRNLMMEQPEDSLLLSYLECFIYQKDRGQCLEMSIVSPLLYLTIQSNRIV